MTRPPHDLSPSQWRKWDRCPAAAQAEYILGRYREAPTEAMAIGALVDAILTQPERLPEIEAEYGSLLRTRSGEYKAEPGRMVEVARAVRVHPHVRHLFEGGAEFQASLRVNLGGAVWLCRPDIIHHARRIVVDVKTCPRGVTRDWCPIRRRYVSWPTARGYGYQLAAYRAACRETWPDGKPWSAGLMAIPKGTLGAHVDDHAPGSPLVAPYVLAWDAAELDAYERHLAESWTCDHLSRATGDLLPPVQAMKAAAVNETLPRCGACDWCETHRPAVTVWRDPEART
jgi:hypothetical protein